MAFWYVDAAYANPDVEILNAVELGLATTGGPLILASSPHARRGALWDVFKRHYGAGGDPLILVAHGATRTLNPSLPQRVVDHALEKDRARATEEYIPPTSVYCEVARSATEDAPCPSTLDNSHMQTTAARPRNLEFFIVLVLFRIVALRSNFARRLDHSLSA